MHQRIVVWFVALTGLIVAMLAGGVWVAMDQAGPEIEAVRGPMMLYAFAASLLSIAAIILVWWIVDRGTLKPMRALARDMRTLLQAKQIDRSLRIPPHHLLGDLPDSIAQLVDELRGSRREVVRAMATATARVEQEKGWLEVILLELVREGVMVCSMDHRLLLYNQPAAQLFRGSHSLGLGRPLFNLVAQEPVRHALEQLQYRAQEDRPGASMRFVCATCDARLMLQARIALILDQSGKSSGYVLTLEDISAELAELQRNEEVRRIVTRDLRAPVASLRAAAETLANFPEMDPEQRHAFDEVILKEGALLSERIEDLSARYRGQAVGRWPTTEIYSLDLLNCIARHMEESAQITVAIRGEPQWLRGDSHSLMLMVEHLIDQIRDRGDAEDFELEAGIGRTRAYLELRWRGTPIPGSTLDEWLKAPVPAMPGTTLESILEQHGSEPWSKGDDGNALLRIPLQPPADTRPAAEQGKLPPRPEFYDFDLMYAHAFTGELGARRLKDVTYVIFDLETTGLKPTQGDEIISVGAVRVTKGRVLKGETYESFVNPGRSIPKDSIRFHGITDEMVRAQPTIAEVLPRFREFAGDDVLVAHNAAFDMKFLKLKEATCGVTFGNPVLDTLLLSVLIEGEDEDHSLDGLSERLGVTIEDRHSALGDALATAEVLVHFLDRLEAQGIQTFEQLMRASNMTAQLRHRENIV